MRVLMRLRMLLPDIADAHTHPYAMSMHEPGPVYLLRRAVRKLQLPALRVLLQLARNPNPHSYSYSYIAAAHSNSYPYLHPHAYSHPDARPAARPRSPA